jgi:hypothetical protein
MDLSELIYRYKDRTADLGEKAQGYKGGLIGAGLFVFLLGMLLIGRQLVGGKHPSSAPPTEAWFTTDDGATLFEDDPLLLPPFDHNGKEAVSAFPYTADGGNHQWVQFLLKYPSDTKTPSTPVKSVSKIPGVPLVKKPGDRDWVSCMDPRAIAIMKPQAPSGMGGGAPLPVLP